MEFKQFEDIIITSEAMLKIDPTNAKIYANIAGKTNDGKDLITKDAIAVEVDIMRGTWKQN